VIALRSVCATAATFCRHPPCLWVSPQKSTEFHSTANLHSMSAHTELALGFVVYVLWRKENKMQICWERNRNRMCMYVCIVQNVSLLFLFRIIFRLHLTNMPCHIVEITEISEQITDWAFDIEGIFMCVSWIKIDQLDVTCFIISLFTAQRVSNISTSIFRSLRLICGFISCVVLLWFDVCWCYGVVRLGWCGILM